RARFEPSEELGRPYVIVGAVVIAADTDEDARRLFTTPQQQVTNMLSGVRGQLRPPIDDIESYWTSAEETQATRMLTYAFVGSRETVRDKLRRFTDLTKADEVMVVSAIYDHAARLRSYEILAEIVSKSACASAPA